MKNLYLFIIFLLFAKSYSQVSDLQNANWIFGDDIWLRFNTAGIQNQASVPASAFDSPEGLATVSDLDGNLLFWTDGTTVYWLNGTNVLSYNSPEALFGNGSSFQNVVITPRPNTLGRYYIFYISGYTSMAPGQVRGLYYAEVDTINHVILNPNTPLLDVDGTLIDDVYGNVCEALTTAPATNGDYWLITHVQNDDHSFIYTFRISENSINNEFQLPFPNNISNPSLSIKVSRDLNLIALSRDGVNPVVGNFDASNGSITNLSLIGNTALNGYCNGLEFSPTGNNLFFKRNSNNIVVALNNPNQEFLIDGTIVSAGAIQRALDGNLYIARKGESFLSVINNPDFVGLNQATIANDLGYVRNFQLFQNRPCWTGLPQWVWQNCNQNLTTGITVAATRHEEREDWIVSTDLITFGDGVTGNGVVYHAGNFIDLLPGFEARTTSQFGAYIQGCTVPQSFVYRQSIGNNYSGSSNLVDSIGKFSIIPNPSSNSIDISMNGANFNKVIIASMDGKIVENINVENKDSLYIDISYLKSGIYLVSVTADDGKIYTEKLIKR